MMEGAKHERATRVVPDLVVETRLDLDERENERERRLAELSEFRALFATGVAHDVRTPLTAILGYSELLAEHWIDMPTDERSHAVERIRVSARLLSRRIDELVDVALLERDQLDRAPFAVADVVEAAVAKLDPADTRHLAVDLIEILPPALGHAQSSERVILHLLASTIHLAKQHEVVLRAWAQDDDICISVSESTSAMTAGEADDLFARFLGLPAGAAPPESGVGLYVAKRLAEAQGGELLLVPGIPAGITFTFTLPAAKRP